MKPVNKLDFWKKRLEDTKNGPLPLHYSVFIADKSIWNNLNEKHAEILRKEIKRTDKVIDLGCAYGRSSEMVRGHYTGVDFSPDFIEEARRLYPDKRFEVADLKSLPFKDKEFDVGFVVSVKAMIISNLGQDEWDLMQKECERVCKKLLILEYGTGDKGVEVNPHEYEIIKSR